LILLLCSTLEFLQNVTQFFRFGYHNLYICIREDIPRALTFKALGIIDGINELLQKPVADLEPLALLFILIGVGKDPLLYY
jgi:hypothetical protein